MEKMQTNRDDVSNTQLLAGCMNWGKWGKDLSSDQMKILIKNLIDLDITFFDHADIYGDYTTEKAFGEAIDKTNLKRTQYQICTKLGIQLPNSERNTNIKHYQYDYAYILSSTKRSVELLKCKYIDILLLHRPSPLMNEKEIIKAVKKLKQEQWIKSFGVSNWGPFQLGSISKYIDIHFNQIELSLTQSKALEDGTIDKMKELDIKLMIWSPLGDFYQRKSDDNLVIAVNHLSEKYNVASSAILINWLLQLPIDVYPVFGSTNIKRIKQMQDAYSFDLHTEEWFYLWQLARGKEVD